MLYCSSLHVALSTYVTYFKIWATHNPLLLSYVTREIATDTAQTKRSKTFDMLIRDRVRRGLFDVYWREGSNNLADFYTKALPHDAHYMIMPYIASSSDK